MTGERGVIPKTLLERIITGVIIFWVLFPTICIIGINNNILLHPLLPNLTQYLGCILLLLSILVFMKNKRKIEMKRDLPYLFLLAMLVWIFISAIFSTNREIAFFGSEARHEGALMFLGYAGFFCGALSISREKNKKLIFDLVLGVAVFQSICCFLRYFGIDISVYGNIHKGMFFFSPWEWSAIYNNPNHFGYYLTMIIIYSGYSFVFNEGKAKYLYLLSYVILVSTLIFNNTLGCFIAVCIILILGSLITYIRARKVLLKNIMLIVLLIIITTLITLTANQGIVSSLSKTLNEVEALTAGELNKEAGNGRMELWLGAMEFIKERPIVGFGPDNLKEEYQKIGISKNRPHNEYIQYMAASGIPTLIFYLSALGILYIRKIKSFKSLSNMQVTSIMLVSAYLISAFFGNTMYYTMPYFWMALAMI